MKILGDGEIENVVTAGWLRLKTPTEIVVTTGQITYAIDFLLASQYKMDLLGAGNDILIDITGVGFGMVGCRLYIKQSPTTPRKVSFLQADASAHLVFTATLGKVFVVDILFDGVRYHITTNDVVANSYNEDTDYTSNVVVSDGDAYTTAISKLDLMLGRMIPPLPNKINSLTTAIQGLFNSLVSTADGSVVNGVSYATGLNMGNYTPFYDPKTGNLQLLLDGVSVASIPLTTADDTNTVDTRLNITSNPKFDNFSDVINVTSRLLPADVTVGTTLHSVAIKTTADNLTSTPSSFYKDALVTGVAPTGGSLGLPLSALTKISGVPVLREASVMNVGFTINGCVGYFYKEVLGYITGSVINQTSLSVAKIARTANSSIVVTKDVIIKTGVYETNTKVNCYGNRPDGTTTPALLNVAPSNRIITDSVTNSTLFGINHATNLKTTSNLMLIGGVIRYPSGSFTDVETGLGATDLTLNYDTIVDDRFLEWSVNITNKGMVEFNIVSGVGFIGALENDSLYSLQMKLGAGAWLDANKAYSGIGTVAAGQGCMVVSNSTPSKKVLTFGTTVSGVVAVRLTLKSGSGKSLSQNTTLIQGNS